jgi:hypothetical protein
MVTFLITSFFILAFAAIAIYFWQKPAASTKADSLLPPPGRGLFIDGTPEGRALVAADVAARATTNALAQRTELLERARSGDKSALLQARDTGDNQLYEETLNLFVVAADSDPKLLSLVTESVNPDTSARPSW